MSSSVDGLISGMDTTTLINQLMQLESQPKLALETRRTTESGMASLYRSVAGKFTAIGDAAGALATSGGWRAFTATSSAAEVVSATATQGAAAGSLSFTVDRLASAHTLVSAGSVASTTTVVGGGSLLVSKAGGLGLASLAGDAALALGAHAVKVTLASSGATKTADAALDASTALGTGATLQLRLGQTDTTLDLAAGTYSTPAALVDVVNAAARAAGAGVVASTDATGRLRLTATAEGSANTLQLTGGTALGALHLSTDAAAQAGTDGTLEVDGTAVTLSDLHAGATTTLTLAGGATVTATLAGGLRAGTVTATNVSLGDGSLASVASAINAAKAGVVATMVQAGADGYRLQLASNTTGAASTVTVDPSAFSGALGTLGTLTAGVDATLTVGEGAYAYQVRSAGNAVTGLLPGVTLNLARPSAGTPVTITVAPDGNGMADKVGKLVDAVNAAVKAIKDESGYDAGTRQAGKLLGDGTASRLQQQLYAAVSDPVGASALGSPGRAGVTLDQDGTVAFDRSKFLSAFADDPEAVAALFRQGGTASSSLVAFQSATAKTRAGDYGVSVSRAATRSSVSGALLAAAPATETVSLRVGGAASGYATASYTAGAGQSLANVAAGLNAAIAAQSLALAVSVEGSRLVVRAGAYGAAGAFEVSSSGTGLGLVSAAGAWEPHAEGVDVAGSFTLADGSVVAGGGAGQLLTAPAGAAGAAGLSVRVTASGADVPASGTLAYTPGLAQRLMTLVGDATNAVDGQLTLAAQGRDASVADLDREIADYQERLSVRQDSLKRQFASLEVSLGQLRDQSNWLAGQIGKLGQGA